MKTASDYPITFGYKAVDGVYYGPNGSVGPYHRGEDRAMPIKTPVVVNGVTIGLSGTRYGGAHLHIGRFVNGNDTDPKGGGFTFKNAVVTEIGADDVNGRFVRVQGDGASWVYLHLNAVLVSKGKELKGAPMAIDRGRAIRLLRIYLHGNPTEAQITGLVGKDEDKWLDGARLSPLFKEQTTKINAPATYKPYDGEPLYVKS